MHTQIPTSLPAPLDDLLRSSVCAALTGAGGKTSLLELFSRRLARDGRAVLVTTTAHIFPPCLTSRSANGPAAASPLTSRGLLLAGARSPAELAPKLRAMFAALPQNDRRLTLGRGVDAATGKLAGLPPEYLCALARELADISDGPADVPVGGMPSADLPDARPDALAPLILVEADGAAKRPLKAHADHEPVIPSCADTVLAVAGLDALFRPLAEACHRPERAEAILGADMTASVTPEHMAALLLHPRGPFRGFRGAPARRAVVLNKLDTAESTAAVAVAHAIHSLDPHIPVFAGSARQALAGKTAAFAQL